MFELLVLLKRTGFVALNLWLAVHVYCVASAPLTMEPHSDTLSAIAEPAQPYNQALFLNHGYHYFAPDVGSSTIIEYRIPRPEDVDITGRFPHPGIGPRLLYHRYFMLADNFRAFPEEFQADIMSAYARHFAEQHDSEVIQLKITEHAPAAAARIVAGGTLSDADSFRVAGEGTWTFPKNADPQWTMEIYNGDTVMRIGSEPVANSNLPLQPEAAPFEGEVSEAVIEFAPAADEMLPAPETGANTSERTFTPSATAPPKAPIAPDSSTPPNDAPKGSEYLFSDPLIPDDP